VRVQIRLKDWRDGERKHENKRENLESYQLWESLVNVPPEAKLDPEVLHGRPQGQTNHHNDSHGIPIGLTDFKSVELAENHEQAVDQIVSAMVKEKFLKS